MMRQISVDYFEEEEHWKQRDALFTQQQLLLVAFFGGLKTVTDLIGKKTVHFA